MGVVLKGLALANLERCDEAIAAAERALRLNPELAQAQELIDRLQATASRVIGQW
ncbi:hypothetical protein H6F67_15650 [Microcoleus sp. FACHB-1515]|uniref:hypothetical protein n=1 Tax=Cyanophyceae TaxID=3028117 RepID=UPI00168647CC|nr:hypothetical protein [Microcoleus sp. FACHB-1515]MBD2091290.1 hypothetical protein [Microcoleus sp. FACHB-1515]